MGTYVVCGEGGVVERNGGTEDQGEEAEEGKEGREGLHGVSVGEVGLDFRFVECGYQSLVEELESESVGVDVENLSE